MEFRLFERDSYGEVLVRNGKLNMINRRERGRYFFDLCPNCGEKTLDLLWYGDVTGYVVECKTCDAVPIYFDTGECELDALKREILLRGKWDFPRNFLKQEIIGSLAMVLDKEMGLLIGKRAPSPNRKRPGAGQWAFPGGKLEPEDNANPLANIRRELREELAFDAPEDRFAFLQANYNEWDPKFDPFLCHLFVIRVSDEEKASILENFDREEHLEMKFITNKEVLNGDTPDILGFSRNQLLWLFLRAGMVFKI